MARYRVKLVESPDKSKPSPRKRPAEPEPEKPLKPSPKTIRARMRRFEAQRRKRATHRR